MMLMNKKLCPVKIQKKSSPDLNSKHKNQDQGPDIAKFETNEK